MSLLEIMTQKREMNQGWMNDTKTWTSDTNEIYLRKTAYEKERESKTGKARLNDQYLRDIWKTTSRRQKTTRSIRIAHKLIYNLRIPNTSLPLPIAGAVRAHVLWLVAQHPLKRRTPFPFLEPNHGSMVHTPTNPYTHTTLGERIYRMDEREMEHGFPSAWERQSLRSVQ